MSFDCQWSWDKSKQWSYRGEACLLYQRGPTSCLPDKLIGNLALIQVYFPKVWGSTTKRPLVWRERGHIPAIWLRLCSHSAHQTLHFVSLTHKTSHSPFLLYKEFKLTTCILPSCFFSMQVSISPNKGCELNLEST